jgi:hypothetical protein
VTAVVHYTSTQTMVAAIAMAATMSQFAGPRYHIHSNQRTPVQDAPDRFDQNRMFNPLDHGTVL